MNDYRVIAVAQKLGIETGLALWLFRKLGVPVREQWDTIKPGAIDAARDVLNGIGAVFMWGGEETQRITGMPRKPGESTRDWIVRTLDHLMRSEVSRSTQPETEKQESKRSVTFAPPSKETTEKEKRGGDEEFSERGPAPIKYPEATLSHKNTRLLVSISKQQAAALLYTDAAQSPMPWETFDLVIDGGLGWLERIRCVSRVFESVVSVGGVVVLRDEIFEPQRRMVENILYGVCILTAEKQASQRSGYRGSFLSAGELEPAIDAMTRPSHDIEVDFVREAEEELSSATPGERRRVGKSVLVRGHHAMQPCGPGGTERRKIWRRPHYSPRLGLRRSEQRYELITEH